MPPQSNEIEKNSILPYHPSFFATSFRDFKAIKCDTFFIPLRLFYRTYSSSTTLLELHVTDSTSKKKKKKIYLARSRTKKANRFYTGSMNVEVQIVVLNTVL